MDVSIRSHEDYLEIVVSGAFSLADGKRGVDELFRASAAHPSGKVLIDGRAIPTQVDIASRFALAEYLATGAGRPLCIAVLVTTELARLTKTFENTAVNRGVKLISTDSMEEARAFLELD